MPCIDQAMRVGLCETSSHASHAAATDATTVLSARRVALAARLRRAYA
jgi:hypothetical protein